MSKKWLSDQFYEKYKERINSNCFNKSFNYKELDEFKNKDIIPTIEVVSLSEVVGHCRASTDADNLIDFLKHFKKEYLLKVNIDELLDTPRDNDFPVLYKVQSRYYVGDGGLHRFCLAMAEGKKSIKFIVYDCDNHI